MSATTQNIVNKALEALTKVLDSTTKLTDRERDSLKLLHTHAQNIRKEEEAIQAQTADPLDKARRLNLKIEEFQTDTDWLRLLRNSAIRDALNSGVSSYRIAKELALTQQAIYKIRDQK